MWIESLGVKNCRLIKDSKLLLSPNFNVIFGDNASGKTSIIEAINILSTGKSFRTNYIADVISHGSDHLVVSGKVCNIDQSFSMLGIEKTLSKKTKIRIDKQNVFLQSKLSRHLPVTVIHPASSLLITGGPNIRRSFIDWMAFYLYPEYQNIWKSYKHVLKQRNTCLKSSKHYKSLSKWTEELVYYQPLIIDYRRKVIKCFVPYLEKISGDLLNHLNIIVNLTTGLPNNIPLETEALLNHYKEKESHDLKVMRTTTGVHTADFSVLCDNKSAAKYASKGQLKLITIALLLAQSKTIQHIHEKKSIILMDDLSSELDLKNSEIFLNYLLNLNQQIIITSTSKSTVLATSSKCKMFHVKQGSFESL